MKGFENQTYLIAYLISNVAAILILLASIRKPKAGRILLSLLFGWACWRNYTVAVMNPGEYLAYADLAIPLYRNFILGWFKEHVTLFVSAIAIGQGLISAGMLLNNSWVRLACIGAVIFLLAIAPLGVASAFPFSLTVSGAALYIYFRDSHQYIWERSHKVTE